MKIKKTLQQIPFELGNTIQNYSNSITKAFNNNACDLDITAKIKIANKDGKNLITVHIEFFPEPKLKSEKHTVVVDERQIPLPSSSKNKFHEILFRNFDDLRLILSKLRWMQDSWKKTSIVFKKF